jgi:hypothetical protein
MDIAVECGQLKVVEWLARTCHGIANLRHLRYASENGHSHVVEWVKENLTLQ